MALALLPEPKKLGIGKGRFVVPPRGVVSISGRELHRVAEQAREVFRDYAIHVATGAIQDPVTIRLGEGFKKDGYRLAIRKEGVLLEAGDEAGAFYGMQTLKQIAAQSPKGALPCLEIEDWPDFEVRGLCYDVTRGRVPKLESLMQLADTLASYKINQLQLYVEYVFPFRRHPDISRGSDPISPEDFMELDAHCRTRHVELVPVLQSFSHMGHVLKHPQYCAMSENWGIEDYISPKADPLWGRGGWTMSPADSRVYELLEDLYAEYLPCFSSTRVNVTCDETFDLGYGQSLNLCHKLGTGRVYLNHVLKARDLAARHGKRIMIWGDMLRTYGIPLHEVPKDVVVLDWNYNADGQFERISAFTGAGLETYACPGTNGWSSLFPDLTEAQLNISGFAAAAKRHGAKGILNTDWGDGGHSNFMEYSWHGYLVGAEQAWNAGADQRTFNKRFARTLLRSADPALARAIGELGEIAAIGPSTHGRKFWREVLFALHDDAVLKLQGAQDARWTKSGRIRSGKMCLDAALGRRAVERLSRVREVFEAHSGQAGEDPSGILPYWIFAVDQIAAAARKLSVLGPGGQDTKAARKGLKEELKALRKRFVQLWMARSRRSEIHMALGHYDRAIRGQDVRVRLEEISRDRVRLTAENVGAVPASGALTLTASPPKSVSVRGNNQLALRRLKPGASRSTEFALRVAPDAPWVRVDATATAPGIAPTHRFLYGDWEWSIPRVEAVAGPGAVKRALAGAPMRLILWMGEKVAEVRAAVAGDDLAVWAKVSDWNIHTPAKFWEGSCFELLGSQLDSRAEMDLQRNPAIGQVQVVPLSEERGGGAFYNDGDETRRAREVRHMIAPTARGYAVSALIPLTLLKIEPTADRFLLEVVVTSAWRKGYGHARASLFHAALGAFIENSRYGTVTVV